jgi:hypothetical protein
MVFLLALRGKTAHGGGYGSRSPPVRGILDLEFRGLDEEQLRQQTPAH